MPIVISCPSCARQLRVPEDLRGKSVRCPSCQTVFTAEEAGAAPSEPPSEPPGDGQGGMQTEPPESPPRERDEERDDNYPRESRRSSSRGDYAPHRGGLVMGLGIASVVTGALSFLSYLCMCIPYAGIVAWIASVVFALVAIGLGIPTLIMGNRDMASMKARNMDPAGEGQTRGGWICSIIGLVLGALDLVCITGMCILTLVAGVALFSSQPH